MTTEQQREDVALEKEKRRQMDAIFWGGAFVLAGLVFLAENLGLLPDIGTEGQWWFWVFLAAGVWALLINVYRLVSPDWPVPDVGDYIWTAILLFIGLGGALDFEVEGTVIAAVVLIGIGLLILVGMYGQRA
jgi:hypothetical protein